MFFDKRHNLRKGPDGRVHSLDPREEESLQRQYAKVSSMTEEEAKCLMSVMAQRTRRPSQEMANAINELGLLLATIDLSIKFTGSDVILQLDDSGETFVLPALKSETDASVIDGELLGELADKLLL